MAERRMFEEVLSDEINDLQQEPCEDAISREYILSKAHCCCDDLADDEPCCVDVDDIKNAPSVKPKPIECEDCISRKAVLDALNKWDWQELYLPAHFKDMIDDLPSIQPKTDVLDKIRAEINSPNRGTCDYFIVDRIEEIINKHTAESEG